MFTPMYFSSSYAEWMLILGAIVLGLVAQGILNSTFKKYSKVPSHRNLTGAQTAQSIINNKGYSTAVFSVNGNLSDHFDPAKDVVKLSDSTFSQTSIAAISVAAHECGHVEQFKEGYGPMKLRSALVPVVNIGQQLGMPLLLVGLLFGFMQLAYLGIALFSFALIFQLVTLPVELNASSRAVVLLQSQGLIDSSEVPAVKKVLNAAAFTYVAAALASVLQLARFLIMAKSRDRD